MELTPFSVAIGSGDGLVARSGDLVMYIADPTGAGALLRALESASAAPSPGRALAKALAAVALGPDSALIPSFGLLAPTDDGLLLILRGGVAAHVEVGGVSRTLIGDRALTWVDETVPEPVDTVIVGAANASAVTARTHTDLRAGVVPGGGFVLRRKVGGPSAEPTPPVVAKQVAPERVAPEQPQATRIAPRQPPAPATRMAAPAPPPAGPTAMPRPVIGVLADDEATYPLDRAYVIGRNPLNDESVRSATASPIFVPDDPQVSRVHAYVTPVAGLVMLRDAGTAAGTFIAAPGDVAWIRLGDQPTELKPGGCVRIGQRILVYRKASSAQ